VGAVDPGLLAGIAPFAALDAQERAAVAAASEVREYPAGYAVLVEDGDPADVLYVILSGSMELVHGDVEVDVLSPGECFGHPSLLSGSAPAFTVRAREPARCLLVPRDAAMGVLSRPAGVRWLARSLRHRLVETGHAAHALPELSTSRIGALVPRHPLVLPAQTTVRDAAAAMTRRHTPAALVDLGDDVAIVTDQDLRERVLAAGAGPETPVAAIARRDVLRVPADRTAGEALVELLDHQRRELCVVDGHGRLLGLLSAEEIAGGAHSPFALRLEIARTPDAHALAALLRDRLARLLRSLLSAGLAHADICRVLTVQSDAATVRLLDFAFERHGPPPVPWAWLALGSVARRELTLGSDQDNALAYGDAAGPGVDAYFARVAADVNAGLSRCGLGEDVSGVLARSPEWRMSAAAWERTFRDCLEFPDRSRLVRASVAFDFRAVAGPLEIVPPLVDVLREAREHPGFIARLARTVTDLRLPLRRGGRLATDRDGTIDLKTGGALPIANLARVHALAGGITISNTVDRLTATEETGQLDAESAIALREAFAVVNRIRLEHHAACLAEGRAPDNRVHPDALPPLRRVSLREAVRAVGAAQRRLMVHARPGI
jgi:CBS domain-containing protein